MKKKNVTPNNDNFLEANYMNNKTYIDYFNRLKKLALSIFEWVNLPDTCNSDYLELCLFSRGMASLLYDDTTGFLNAEAISNGYINMYNLPTKFDCKTANGTNYMRDLYIPNSNKPKGEECILVKNNIDMYSTSSSIELFAYRLYIAERTIDINMFAQRTPVIIGCDDKSLYTVKQAFTKYDGFEPIIIGLKDFFENDKLKALKTDAPYLIDKLEAYKEKIWNEALSFLGINNIANEKKERLTENESNVNNELINLNLQSFMMTREQACKDFNEKYKPEKPLEIRVRSDLNNIIKTTKNSIIGENKSNSNEKEVTKNE